MNPLRRNTNNEDLIFLYIYFDIQLSSGKDNRVVCWALEDGGVAPIIYSELSTVEWQDNVRWSPCLPGLIAASSHIEGVVVESIQERQSLSTKHVPRWYKVRHF